MKKLIEKINKIPFPIALLVYQLLLTGRVFIELGATKPSIFIMQIFWYNSVLMFFIIYFKYLLKLKNNELSVLTIGGFLPYIPMIYSVLMHHRWHLNFITPVSVKQVAFDMLTLCAVHEFDWPLFPELLTLLIGSFILAFIMSGKLLKSALAALLSVYSFFFCIGFAWLSVKTSHPAFVYYPSGFVPAHVFYSLYYISVYSILAQIAFFREILDFIKRNGRKTCICLFALSALFVISACIFLFVKGGHYPVDYIFVSIPAASLPFLFIISKIYLPIFKKSR